MLRRILTVMLFGALVAGVGLMTPMHSVVRAESEASSSEGESAALDRIVFTNGNVLECRVIEETPTYVLVKTFFNGMEMGEQEFQKSQIIEIQRGVGAEASAKAVEEGMVRDDEEPKEEIHPDAARVYMVEFEGQFGSDISETPLTEMFEDVDEVFDDLVEGTIDGKTAMVVDPEVRDKHIVVIEMDCGTDPRLGFDGIWRFKDLDPIFEREFHKGRRIVFWVDRASDGAAIVPWISPEIYFHKDGRMWFTQDLEDFDIGDDVVDEKQISLRIGQARSYAIEGGYDKLSNTIIKAMVRSRYWLYYRLEGGEPVFHQGKLEPEEAEAGGWILLSDNGSEGYEDKLKDRVTNDRLVLDAETAELVDLSKGIADDEESLMYEMGVHRNYHMVENRAERIFEKWNEAKEQAFERINNEDGTLWIEFQRIDVGGEYDDRKRARGRQIAILKEIHSDFARFAEVWDPNGQNRSQISTRIEQIRKAQQADKAAERARG